MKPTLLLFLKWGGLILLLLLALLAIGASGQTIWQHEAPPANPKFLLIVEEMEVDPFTSYAMNCGPTNPGCNTVYRPVAHYRPFVTAKDALDYLAQNPRAKFVSLNALVEVKVKVTETQKTTAQPPIVEKVKTYELLAPKPQEVKKP